MTDKFLIEAIRQLLHEGNVKTQEELCLELEKQGYELNQSKISRLLRKFGAIKTKNEQNKIVYRLPNDFLPPSAGTALEELIIDIIHNENMIVIHTSPGSASVIARLLDYHREKIQVLGTIAGDDTIFIIPTSTNNLKMTIDNVKSLLS